MTDKLTLYFHHLALQWHPARKNKTEHNNNIVCTLYLSVLHVPGESYIILTLRQWWLKSCYRDDKLQFLQYHLCSVCIGAVISG